MRVRTLLTACVIALVSAAFALAGDWDRKIQFTFDKPVSIPAVHQPGWGVLRPGTYVFRIHDSAANRHIVEILNKEETEIYATILALPNSRLKVTDKAVIQFRETPAGQPFALRAMFYPGRAWGEEFVYPKTKATELARVTSQPVLSMPAPLKEEEAMPEAPQVIAALEAAPVTAVEPSGAEVQTAEVVTEPPLELLARNEPPKVLPQTASPLPLIGVLGMLSVMAGFGLRFAEKRLR